ncbi:MAG: Hpt domain-containing protein [Candidatus Thermoplasmatota archaeon]
MRPLPVTAGMLDSQSLVTLRRTLGTEESYQDILRTFLTSSNQLARQLERGLAGAPSKDVVLAAHTLKSMARLVGANALGEACREVERRWQATPPVVSAQLLRTTLEQLAATRRAVGSLVA